MSTDDIRQRGTVDERARTMLILLGIVFPVLVTSTGVIATLLWVPEVPDPAAIHWSASGVPDGFGPAWTFPAAIAGIGYGLTALLVAMVALTRARTQPWGPMTRFLGAFMPGAVAAITVSLCGAMAAQRGLADAREATTSALAVLAVPAVWVIVTVAFWLLQPRVPVRRAVGDTAEDVPLAPSERAVWMHTVTASAGGIAAVTVATLAVLAGAVVLALARTPAAWILLGVAVLLVLMLSTMLAFRVRVDERGLSVVSVGGWPRFAIAIGDVAAVSIDEISPMADFGGWGVRYGPGRGWGVIMRSGEAIVVERRSGARFTVVVPDAARGAGVLEALRERRGDDSAR